MTFLNAALLFGLFALAVPPLLHLLNRRRFDVIEWAAMQFLHISRKTRRRIFFEQFLLMLLRMLMILLAVLAIAAPEFNLSCTERIPGLSRFVSKNLDRSNRDIVILIDGSYSMGYEWQGKSVDAAAREWIKAFLNDATPGDSVAILQVKQQPIPVVPELSSDLRSLGAKLDAMPGPRGGIDWPRAFNEAVRILGLGKNQRKEMIVLSDGQRHGWADPRSLYRWELFTKAVSPSSMPRIWVVNVVPERPTDLPNWTVSPLQTNRAVAVAGREVKFRYEVLQVRDVDTESTSTPAFLPKQVTHYVTPEDPDAVRSKTSSDVWKTINTWEPATIQSGEGKTTRFGGQFNYVFPKPGSYRVNVTIDKDELPGDNSRDYAVEVVPSLPVLIIDGDPRSEVKNRTSDFLRDALAPPRDKTPPFLVRTVSISGFAGEMLQQPITRDPSSLPRVVILQDVADLRAEQSQAIEAFLKEGGGVLYTLGPRSDSRRINDDLFRDGRGWFPARLLEEVGDENDLSKAAQPIGSTLDHPALILFKKEQTGGFAAARFPRYWKLEPGSEATLVIATLSTRLPLFVEKSVGKGRVILSAVPLDNRWRTNLHTSWEFVILAHELAYYLAGARGSELNIAPGQPIVYHPRGVPPVAVTIKPPEGPERRVEVKAWPLVFEETRDPGTYQLITDTGMRVQYVVQPDFAESNLVLASDAEKRAVANLFPRNGFHYENDVQGILRAIRESDKKIELWWLFLLLVIVLLVGEIFMTRHLVKKNPPIGDQ